ncbi:MAG TPA: M56 family metallopeptidase [Gemmatimonadaceae bacterium]|nr:M56 family metallopeptidase [Gemmatimonadaceae bacterium]
MGVFIAAAILESALRAIHQPARLVWIAAICFPILAACWSAQLWRTPDLQLPVPSSEVSLDAARTERVRILASAQWAPPQFVVAVGSSSQLAQFDSALLALWLGGCFLTLGAFGGAAMKLRRITSRGQTCTVAGVRVVVTATTGPLVVGIFHPEIIVPTWVLELTPAEQQLVIAHEREHLRGRDPALLACAAVVVVLASWNPLLWYMMRRLRRAVEFDCDRRVLTAHPDTRAYAGLLISVAGRGQASLLPAVGLAASVSSLEQRFRYMTKNPTHHRGSRLISALAMVVILLVGTAMIPRPIPEVDQKVIGVATQGRARATGRVKVTSISGPVTYRVYAWGGSFSEVGKPARAKADTLVGVVGDGNSAGDVFDIDVTDGDLHFVSQDKSSIRVEAAMSGASRALSLTGTSRHVVIQRGGGGIHGGGTAPMVIRATAFFYEYQVDTPVVLRESITPRYPAALKQSGIGGEVAAQFVVDLAGRVDMRTFEALKSPGPLFTAAVEAALPTWRLDPAIRQGKKVKQLVQVSFVFQPPPAT